MKEDRATNERNDQPFAHRRSIYKKAHNDTEKKTAARRYENGKTPKEKKAILPGQEASTAADDLPTAEITTNETSK